MIGVCSGVVLILGYEGESIEDIEVIAELEELFTHQLVVIIE